jgi:hypothetical protein
METLQVRPIGAAYYTDVLPTDPSADKPTEAEMRSFEETARESFAATGKKLCDFQSRHWFDLGTERFHGQARMIEYEPLET